MLSWFAAFLHKSPGNCMPADFRQLILCPTDPYWVPETRSSLEHALRRLALLGGTIGDPGLCRYLIGESFLQSFSFMGCAPSIEFEPDTRQAIDWQGFIFIQLSPTLSQPRWLADKEAKPACPACRQRTREWAPFYREADATLECPHCRQRESVCHWRWFDAGACARQFVSVVNVYPKESLPTDALLQEIHEQTGTPWQYFYLHAPLITAD